MTGAPKLRSVQLLENLEGHARRGPYAGKSFTRPHRQPQTANSTALIGAFGFVSVDGAADFAVVIRTLVIRGEREFSLVYSTNPPHTDVVFAADLALGGGGAITHLSDPEKEWEEVLVKIDAVTGRAKA